MDVAVVVVAVEVDVVVEVFVEVVVIVTVLLVVKVDVEVDEEVDVVVTVAPTTHCPTRQIPLSVPLKQGAPSTRLLTGAHAELKHTPVSKHSSEGTHATPSGEATQLKMGVVVTVCVDDVVTVVVNC